MNNYQTAKLASYKLIVREAKNFPREVALIPSFESGINRLEGLLTSIDEIGIQQAKAITGITNEKNTVMSDLTDNLVDISGAIHSYAISVGDKKLLAKVNYKESAIARMPQFDLVNAAGIVIEEAEKIAPEVLINEGITANELAVLKTAFLKFKEVSSEPREAIIERSGQTQQLADLFTAAADLKKNTLDRLASQFKSKAPDFYQRYKAAAMVIYRRATKSIVLEEVK